MFPYQRGDRKEDQCNEDSNVFMYNKLFWKKPKIEWINTLVENNTEMNSNQKLNNASNKDTTKDANGNHIQSQTKSNRHLSSTTLKNGDKNKVNSMPSCENKNEEEIRNIKLKNMVDFKQKNKSSIINPFSKKDKEDKS